MELNRIIHADCMDIMKDIPDKYFELAIVDPPYGINKDGQRLQILKNPKQNKKEHIKKDWDKEIPKKKYFEELFRISENQIIWGGNYFTQYLNGSMGWIFWDKGQELCQSDGELAFTSFNRALRRIIINRGILLKDVTIHPTQKPVKLYKWLLKNYAKPNDKIIDTHSGSGTTAVACIDMGFDYLCIEKDKDYYEASVKRINKELLKIKMFA